MLVHQRSRSRGKRRSHSRLALSLVLTVLVGCQSLTTHSQSTTARSQHATARSVSDATLVSQHEFDLSVPTKSAPIRTAQSSKPQAVETWQLHKTQRETAIRQASQRSSSEANFSFTSLSSNLWTSEEPAACFQCQDQTCESCPPAFGNSWFDDEPHCDEFCFGCDCAHAFPTLWSDAKSVVRKNNLLILGVAAGAAIALREGDGDREVREWVQEHPKRWGEGSEFLGDLGRVEVQVPVMAGLYGYSLWAQDEELHELMGTILSAAAITGVSTTALKLITDTSRPTNKWMDGRYGFPSYHTSSTFAVAAVLDEYYGARVGLPAYALAGAIGFSRIDEQDHDLSDVIFGGTLGFVIGKAVAGRHLCGNSEIHFGPYFHPTDGTPGVGGEWRF